MLQLGRDYARPQKMQQNQLARSASTAGGYEAGHFRFTSHGMTLATFRYTHDRQGKGATPGAATPTGPRMPLGDPAGWHSGRFRPF
jgi:hypothetical protein